MYKMPEVTNFKKKDNTYCCVPLCNSRGSKNPDLSFHLFPSEKKELARRRKWILALRIGRPVSQRMSVCSRHFVHSDYTLPPHYERKRPRLRNNAVPSLNLPVPDSCEGKPKKRPTTVMITKESSSVQADGEKSEENDEQEDLEIEVNIKSERDIFGTDYNIESEGDYYRTDDNIEPDYYRTDDNIESDYYRTDNNIESLRDYLETNDNIESERGYYRTDDNIDSKRGYIETDDSSQSERDYFDTEGNIGFQRDNLETDDDSSQSQRDYFGTRGNIVFQRDDVETDDNTESDRDYLDVNDYLQVENNIESEQEEFQAGSKIESMTLMTLSKKLI